MNNINYQKELEKELEIIKSKGNVLRLLLHSCCGPCSSYCIEYLSEYFEITVLYYNPNIYPPEEYEKRVIEQQEFIRKFPTKYPVRFVEGAYDTKKFYGTVRGFEQCPEKGERCSLCYRLRLEEAARYAKEGDYDYFTTTLSISPLKDAVRLNETGRELSEKYGIPYLFSDFKKKDGYRRSSEISKEYGMYRQDYCGCEFSLRSRLEQSK